MEAIVIDKRERIHVRVARNRDGASIAALSWQVDAQLDANWAQIEPYWLVAENDAGICGAVQLCPGLPVGRLEMLYTDQHITKRQRARVVRALLLAGAAQLKRMGAQYVAGHVAYGRRSFRDILYRRGARPVSDGTIYLRRI